MELVKRRFLNIGSTYGPNLCREAVGGINDDPESSMYEYCNRPMKRGEYFKCYHCRFRLKPKMCDKFACMRNERKDGVSVYFDRV